jgi:glycosyltransferase involved in cell wall biosynthesis
VRIALVIPGYQADASDWCIPAFTNLAHELAKSVELHVFALRYPGVRRDYKIGDVNVHAIGGGAVMGRRVYAGSLLKLWHDALSAIEREDAKARFTNVVGIWATESGWLATVAAKRLGVPSLVHLAGGELVWLPDIRYGNQGRGLARLLVRRCLRNADVLTVPSSPVEWALPKQPGIQPGKVKRWALGVDTQMFQLGGSARPQNGSFTFVAVGSLIPVKGHAWLLEAMAELAKADQAGHLRPTRLKIVGDGPLLPDLRALAQKLNLEGYVEFLGEVPHEDLPGIYRSADCFLLGSRHEAQCMAALEAMSCGLPWIGPAVGALADCAELTPGEAPSGIVVKDRSVPALVEAMRSMLGTSTEERDAWGAEARRRVVRDYSLRGQTSGLLAILSG